MGAGAEAEPRLSVEREPLTFEPIKFGAAEYDGDKTRVVVAVTSQVPAYIEMVRFRCTVMNAKGEWIETTGADRGLRHGTPVDVGTVGPPIDDPDLVLCRLAAYDEGEERRLPASD